MKMTSQACSISRIEPAHGRTSGARRRAGLGAAAFAFDRAPRAGAPLRAGRPLPNPALALFAPSLPDQGPSQAITMLREIVAEAAFHAGGALVGHVQLDIGRG